MRFIKREFFRNYSDDLPVNYYVQIGNREIVMSFLNGKLYSVYSG